MDISEEKDIKSSYGHLSIAQKYPRQYTGKGVFTIPFGWNATPLSSYDFTIDQRDKIYLKENDKSDIPVTILFYDEAFLEQDLLNIVRDMFLNSSSKIGESIFRFCNLSVETILAEEFRRIRGDKTHPFNTILSPNSKSGNPVHTNIFVLVYKKGYPQCIYEGPVNEESFTEFIVKFSKDSTYFNEVKKNSENVKEQLWISYNRLDSSKKGSLDKKFLEAFSDAPTLVEAVTTKPRPWPRGFISHTKAILSGAGAKARFEFKEDKGTFQGIKDDENNIWRNTLTNYFLKFQDKVISDQNNKNPLSAIYIKYNNYNKDKRRELCNELINAIFTSYYNDFFIPRVKKIQQNSQNNKNKGEEMAIVKNNALMIYGLLTALLQQNIYDSSFLGGEDPIKISVDYYGCYLYKKDENFDTDNKDKLRGLFITEGLNIKYATFISNYIYDNDSKILKILKEKYGVIINKFNQDKINSDSEEEREKVVDVDSVLDAIKTNVENNIALFKKSKDELFKILNKEDYPFIKYKEDEDDNIVEEEFDDDDNLKEILEELNGKDKGKRIDIYNSILNPEKSGGKK